MIEQTTTTDLVLNKDDQETIIAVRGLTLRFYTYAGVVKALDGINFEIKKNETLGIVGETGCGKSITAHAIMRLVRPPGKIIGGKIYYKGKYSNDEWINLLNLKETEMRKIRGHYITMIFQDPMTYLNPVFKIGDQITETILLHQTLEKEALLAKIDKLEQNHRKTYSTNQIIQAKIDLLKKQLDNPPRPSKEERKEAAEWKAKQTLHLVRMPYVDKIMDMYPFELSGGMRQRVMIAIALASLPEIMIADEATTALDVTIQAQILHLFQQLRKELQTTLVLITHDLGIVAEQCDRVLVMYAGNIIESAETKELFKNPTHTYTKGLLAAVPKLHQDKLSIIPGIVPNLITVPSGCRFHPRCHERIDICSKVKPRLSKISENHFVACHVHGTKDYVDMDEEVPIGTDPSF